MEEGTSGGVMLQNKIIVAEDDDSIAYMVNMALGDGGYLCLRARDGYEAISMVRMHTPDLLILDVMLPKMDGMEVARKLKADVLLSRTSILMLTALASVDNKVAGFEAGADDYLAKPFDLRELSARVTALIRTTRREADRNPTTLLPGTGAVDARLCECLKRGDKDSIVYFRLCGFDQVTSAIGYTRAETILAQLGTLVLESSRTLLESPFVGHVGGADFLVLCAGEVVDKLTFAVLDTFASERATLLQDMGSVSSVDMVAGIVETDDLGAKDAGVLAQRLEEVLTRAEQKKTDRVVRWSPPA